MADSAANPPARVDRPRAFWLLCALLAGTFVLPKIFMHESGNTADLDTGIYSNLAWGLVNGQGWYGSVLGRNNMGEHFSPIIALLSPFYLAWPTAHVLMVAQGLAAAAAVALVLWLLDRFMVDRGVAARAVPLVAYRWRAGACGLMLFVALLYRPMLAAWSFQFQPIVLGMPLVVAAIAAMHLGRDRRRDGRPGARRADVWLAVWVALLLTTRESAVLSVLGLGLYAGLVLRRWRLMLLLAAAAGVAAVFIFKVSMPYFREAGADWNHARRLGWDADWEGKRAYLQVLVLGAALLPLIGRRALATTLAAVPGVLLNVAVDYEWQYALTAHYDAQTSAFLLVAAAHGLAAVAAFVSRLRVNETARRAVAGVAVIAVGWTAIEYGGATPFERAWEWRPTGKARRYVREARYYNRGEYANALLAATKPIGPQVCHRPDYKTLRSYQIPTLKPGQLILAAPPHLGSKERRRAEEFGQLELVRDGTLVAAYRWLGPHPSEVTAMRDAQESMDDLKHAIRRTRDELAQKPSHDGLQRKLRGQEERLVGKTRRFREAREIVRDLGLMPVPRSRTGSLPG